MKIINDIYTRETFFWITIMLLKRMPKSFFIYSVEVQFV